jgi:cell division protein FtsI (penicillin-binding protein 3)
MCYLKVSPELPVKGAQARDGGTPDACRVKNDKPAEPTVAVEEGDFNEGAIGGVMPDFRGLSMRDVLRSMEKRQLNVRMIGSGRAIAQNPQPGKRIGPREQVWVKFVPSA